MIKLSDDDCNLVFRFVDNIMPCFKEDKLFKITKEHIENFFEDKDIEEDEVKKIFNKLVGYKVKYETDGNHKTDGQLVEYTFTFVNPEKIKTQISTEMSYMCGWNHSNSETIK